MSHSAMIRIILSAVLSLLSAVLVAVGAVSAQEEDGLTPSFGDGKLTILGAGFKPGENVTITVKLADGTHVVNTKADATGKFRLETGLTVKPLSGVELDARGDQGTAKAAITSVPGMPLTGAPTPDLTPLFVAGAAVVLLGTGLLFARRK